MFPFLSIHHFFKKTLRLFCPVPAESLPLTFELIIIRYVLALSENWIRYFKLISVPARSPIYNGLLFMKHIITANFPFLFSQKWWVAIYTTVTPHYFQSCLCIKFMMYINRLVNHSDPNFDITSNYGSLQCSKKCLRPLYECSLMSVPFSEKSKRTTKLTKISIICLMHPMNHCTQMSS